MIYFLFGPDTFRSREKLKELIAKNPGNVQRINQDDLSFEQIKKHFESNSLFSNQKLLIVEGLCSKNFKDKELVANFLNDFKSTDSETIIFLEGKVDKRSSLFKLLNKKTDELYEFELLSPEEMEVWLRKRAIDLGLELNHENRKKLAAMLSNDTWQANNELKKLKALAGGRAVEYTDIDALVRGKLDDDIFKLTDCIAKNEKEQALKVLSDQIEIGNNEIYLLSMIIRQFRIIIQLKSALSDQNGRPDNYSLGKQLGLHPFVVQKSLLMTKRYDNQQLKDIYQKLVDLDFKLKSSKISSRVLLEKFILEI